ncbi:hypothetical protein ACA910_017975 [Epithemia clementina (nom. ined.)]
MTESHQSQARGKVLERSSLYSPQCRLMLEQALEILPVRVGGGGFQRNHVASHGGVHKSRFADSSDDEENGNPLHSPETSDSEDSTQRDEDASDDAVVKEVGNVESLNTTGKQLPQQQPPKRPAEHNNKTKIPKMDVKQHEANVRKHVDLLTCYALPIQKPANAELHLSYSLLSKQERLGGGGNLDYENGDSPSDRSIAQLLLKLSNKLSGSSSSAGGDSTSTDPMYVLVLFLRSGRFAGALFQRGQCTHHRTTTRYTVRKGQGKAQSVQDSQRKAKSVGSQLRRAGEEQLKEDVRQTLQEWQTMIQKQTALILISCPKTMKKNLYDCMEPIIARTDDRIRRVPLDLGRPTFENAVLIHDVLTSATVREQLLAAKDESVPPLLREEASETALLSKQQNEKEAGTSVSVDSGKTNELPIVLPLTALHAAAKNGDLELVKELLKAETGEDGGSSSINLAAGIDFMTPLHYAADSATLVAAAGGEASANVVDPSVAAAVVMELLVQGNADPTRVDARNRVPYFLAAHEKVRDAFRMARSRLGEEYCDWDVGAKVGPALTEDDLQQRRDKEADKKKKKKARQKEKRAKERAQQDELEEEQKRQEMEQQKAQEAKRIRDGLEPKKQQVGDNVCDFCQTVCKGRQRSQMYKRLEYSYCSTECVQKHKRELMAAAALSRFQQS